MRSDGVKPCKAHHLDDMSSEMRQQGSARNFVIFFDQKEGTTPIVLVLNNFSPVSVLHQATGGGWEPFDRHNCGPMDLDALIECLDLVFSGAPASEVNRVYRLTAAAPLAEYKTAGSVGFKMRYRPWAGPLVPPRLETSRPRPKAHQLARFSREMTSVLSRHDVLVFLAVRQDLLRWALSRYHGDGTGRPGHIQFRLAQREVTSEEIPRIRVDLDVLSREIDRCEAIYAEKLELARRLQDAGVDVIPLRYEDFLIDELGFFRDVLAHLGHELPDEVVQFVVAHGSGFERVHGNDLSEFFLNAAELEERFGGRFHEWPGPDQLDARPVQGKDADPRADPAHGAAGGGGPLASRRRST